MFIADTHVHLYPVYDATRALVSAYRRLAAHRRGSGKLTVALFLAERQGARLFRDWVNGTQAPPPNFTVMTSAEKSAVNLVHSGNDITLLMIAGRQLVPVEGIEILCLGADADIPDGLPASETVSAIRTTGGLPVISWAPGKWWGRRGNVVEALINQTDGEPMAIGDTAMRALAFYEPRLMKLARRRGMSVLAGTDPLPFAGDEDIMGTYGIQSNDFDPAQPVTTALALLASGKFSIVGSRGTRCKAAQRWIRNNRVKKR